jgi:hypothetical protein
MSEPIPDVPDVPDVVAARALVALLELIHTDPVARVFLRQPGGWDSPYTSVSRGGLRFLPADHTAGAEQLAAARALFGDGDVTVEPDYSRTQERHTFHTMWQGVPLVILVKVEREDELAALRKQIAELTAREGALAEQRHQLYDPAVPPLAARQPAAVGEAL